jgi:hypothetical protein
LAFLFCAHTKQKKSGDCSPHSKGVSCAAAAGFPRLFPLSRQTLRVSEPDEPAKSVPASRSSRSTVAESAGHTAQAERAVFDVSSACVKSVWFAFPDAAPYIPYEQ